MKGKATILINAGKLLLKILVWVIGWAFAIPVLIVVTFGFGWVIGFEVLDSSNPFGVMLSHVFLCFMFGYLIIRAEVPANDGLSSTSVALTSSWIYAGIATIIIFKIASLGIQFTLLNMAIFLCSVLIRAWRVEKSQNKSPTRKSSVYLADNTLSLISSSGLLTALVAFLLYQLGWFTKGTG